MARLFLPLFVLLVLFGVEGAGWEEDEAVEYVENGPLLDGAEQHETARGPTLDHTRSRELHPRHKILKELLELANAPRRKRKKYIEQKIGPDIKKKPKDKKDEAKPASGGKKAKPKDKKDEVLPASGGKKAKPKKSQVDPKSSDDGKKPKKKDDEVKSKGPDGKPKPKGKDPGEFTLDEDAFPSTPEEEIIEYEDPIPGEPDLNSFPPLPMKMKKMKGRKRVNSQQVFKQQQVVAQQHQQQQREKEPGEFTLDVEAKPSAPEEVPAYAFDFSFPNKKMRGMMKKFYDGVVADGGDGNKMMGMGPGPGKDLDEIPPPERGRMAGRRIANRRNGNRRANRRGDASR